MNSALLAHGMKATGDPGLMVGLQMIAYRFTIEGEITAADAAEAYGALTEVLARAEESLGSYATQVELNENLRITLAPLTNSHD